MASETPGSSTARSGTGRVPPVWLRGMSAGLVGGLGMGVLLATAVPTVVQQTVPALVGLSGHLVGWAVLMANGGLAGIAFTTVLDRQSARPSLATMVSVGVVYGVALWIAAGVALPVWVGVVGTVALPLPWLQPTVLASLLVYGIVLAIGHWLLR